MGQAPDFYFQANQQIKMPKWFQSRVVCLGVTAYAPTPLTGMGTSLAMTGAYILAAELSKLEDGEHPLKALETYESTFRPFVEQVQNISFFIPAVAHPETAWKRWLLQASLSALSMVVVIPWVSHRMRNDDGFQLPQYPSFDERGSY